MLEPEVITEMGMTLDRWTYKSCTSHVGIGDNWATIYDIQSTEEGKNHATELLLIIKDYYKETDKVLRGSIALHQRMKDLYKKCGVEEISDND